MNHLDKQHNIRQTYEVLMDHLNKVNTHIEMLRNQCAHPDATCEYGADVGNYDPSENCYFVKYTCPDCGKRWTRFV